MARLKQNVGSQAMANMKIETETTANEIQAATADALDETSAASGRSFDHTVAAMKDGMSKATATVERHSFNSRKVSPRP